jgi:hypothetical protein
MFEYQQSAKIESCKAKVQRIKQSPVLFPASIDFFGLIALYNQRTAESVGKEPLLRNFPHQIHKGRVLMVQEDIQWGVLRFIWQEQIESSF